MEQLTFNQRVAAEVRAELGRQNLSQACLASELGWVQSQLSRRLRGLVAFSTDEIERIALQLDVPIEQLVREPSAERGAMRLLEEDRRRRPAPARYLTVRTGTDS